MIDDILRFGLEQFGQVTSDSAVIHLCKELGGRFLEEEEVRNLFKENDILYFVVKHDIPVCTLQEEEAQYKLVHVGTAKDSKENYFMFIKKENIWQGVAFGNKRYLLDRMGRSGWQFYCYTEFLEKLYQKLLYKEAWRQESVEGYGYGRLKSYLIELCSIAKRKLVLAETRDVFRNDKKDKVIFDSNLLDNYGNKIVLIHSVKFGTNSDCMDFRFIRPCVVESRKELLSNGFPENQIQELMALSLYNSSENLIFQGDVEDFDLNDTYYLYHLFEERKERLTKEMKEISQADFAYCVKNSIEHAVKMCKLDYQFIKPSFSLVEMKAVFLAPLYKEISAAPLGALVISRQDGKWRIHTVLELEQAYIGARVIAPPTGWLDRR